MKLEQTCVKQIENRKRQSSLSLFRSLKLPGDGPIIPFLEKLTLGEIEAHAKQVTGG